MLASAVAAIDMTARQVPAVLVGHPATLAATRDAVVATGCRIVAETGWADWLETPALPGVTPLVVADAKGVDDDLLAAALPRLEAAARALDAPVVAILDRRSIDVVAAVLLGPRVQLLCEPTPLDVAAALTLAAEAIDGVALSDRVQENEAARLKRLNEEVARIAEVLSRLSRREDDARSGRAGAAEVEDRRQTFGIEPMQGVSIDPAEIRRAIRGRRLRDQFFGTGLFEEPGWDMLLDLFAAEIEHSRVSVSSLCIAAAVAPTTALRWISKLTEAGLFERRPDPLDRRRAYMELSDRAGRAMRDYVGAMRRAGLSLG